MYHIPLFIKSVSESEEKRSFKLKIDEKGTEMNTKSYNDLIINLKQFKKKYLSNSSYCSLFKILHELFEMPSLSLLKNFNDK